MRESLDFERKKYSAGGSDFKEMAGDDGKKVRRAGAL